MKGRLGVYTFTTYPEMALPYEGDSEVGRRNGQYDLTERGEEVRPLNSRSRSSVSHIQPEEDQEEVPNKEGILHRICPSCIMNIPRVFIVLLAILILLFVVCSIPLIFAYTYKSDAQEGDAASTVGRDRTDVWPIPNDDPRMENNSILYLANYLPKNVSKCRGFGFVCANNPGMSIGTNARCDGKADCLDGSDEVGCTECQTSFSCPLSNSSSTRVCLRSNYICDGVSQCSDRSDEAFCRDKCTTAEYKCRQASVCLPKRFLCDGEQHCPSGDDEENCDGKCDNGSRWCNSSKTCLPKWKICDGIKDCMDGTDEADCDCKQCSGQGKMLCRAWGSEENAFCFPGNRVCDGNPDCPNGEDEDGCPGELKPVGAEMIQCNDGKLYSKIYACFGLIPACNGICNECNAKSAFDCEKTNCTFQCKSDKKCIPRLARCDGRSDCADNSDEENCSAELCSIHPFSMYLCSDKKSCFRKSEVCSPYSKCPNSSSADKGYCAAFQNIINLI